MGSKNVLDLAVGSAVRYAGETYFIGKHLSLSSFLLIAPDSGKENVAQLDELSPVETDEPPPKNHQLDPSQLPAELWQEAKRRADIIRPLAARTIVPTVIADEAAQQLNVSQRTIYTLIKQYHESGGLLTALVRLAPTGGRGKSRLPGTVDAIITAAIDEHYLCRQRYRPAQVVAEIHRRCYLAGLKPPSDKTIRRRISALSVQETTKRRQGRKASHRLTPVTGQTPAVERPLDVVQIDHTLVDLILVDESSRQPIGRPYLTIGIDVYSRCITGFCLTLEAPSAVSVGLCLAHSILDKETYLHARNIQGEWPIWGKPDKIYVDNGADFHSEALLRGCEQHGINIDYRPPGQPHFGGIIERVIGTLMAQVHTLPGTTFSNIQARGDYDADGNAVLTLAELEHWLALVIVGHYHNNVHASLNEPPLERFKQGLLGTADLPGPGPRPRLQNKQALLIDFLPLVHRRLQRHGFMLDHIVYYSHALRPWIAERERLEKFIIRRDPRDISRIFVLHPNQPEVLEIPYRTLSHPAMTLWEHRECLRRLKTLGRAKVDEAAIFRTLRELREITAAASSKTRAARRRKARTEYALGATEEKMTATVEQTQSINPAKGQETQTPAQPFDDIEEW